MTLVTNDFPPVHGGIQRYISALADELTLARCHVTVIAPHRDGDVAHDAAMPYDVVRYGGGSLVANFRGMLWTLVRRVGRFARPSASIASLWFPAGLALAILPRAVRGRLFVLVHGAELQPSRGGVRRSLLRFVLGSADAVVANSTYTASLIARCGIERPVAIVHCGVDAFPVTHSEPQRPTILAVGRLIRRKGFDRLLRALVTVIASVPDVRCEIVGDGPLRASLEDDSRALGLVDYVTFAGAVSDEELRAAYGRASCFALPVRNDSDDVEGFGIVYLEAAIAGLPSVGGADSGAQDAIVDGETGLLVDGNDEDAIARALVRLLTDRELATTMGRAGRARALDTFTWAACADGILELLR